MKVYGGDDSELIWKIDRDITEDYLVYDAFHSNNILLVEYQFGSILHYDFCLTTGRFDAILSVANRTMGIRIHGALTSDAKPKYFLQVNYPFFLRNVDALVYIYREYEAKSS